MDDPRQKRARRRLRILMIGFAVAVAGVLVVHASYGRYISGRVEAHLQAIRDAGAPTSMDELHRPPLAPDANAMTLYRQAAARLEALPPLSEEGDPIAAFSPCSGKKESGECTLVPPDAAALGQRLAQAQPALTLLREASACAGFQLPLKPDATGQNTVSMADLQALRALSRYAAAQAWHESTQNHQEAAAAWLETAFELTRRLDAAPLLVTATVRTAMASFAVNTAVNLFEQHPPSQECALRIKEHLMALRDTQGFVYALETERAFSLDGYAAQPEPPSALAAYAVRPLHQRNVAGTLELFAAMIAAVREEEPAQRSAAYAAIDEQVEQGPMMVSLMGPAFLAGAKSLERLRAHCDLLLLAMALRVYRAEEGSYPGTLEGWHPERLALLPEDLYNGGGYGYHRQGEGFILEHRVAAAEALSSGPARPVVMRFVR